eukprot:1972553-Prymnesium_polylepis.1
MPRWGATAGGCRAPPRAERASARSDGPSRAERGAGRSGQPGKVRQHADSRALMSTINLLTLESFRVPNSATTLHKFMACFMA